MPSWNGSPAECAIRSLSSIGTPRNGPPGSSAAAASRAFSNSGVITALSFGLIASIRSIAASTSSHRSRLAVSHKLRLRGGVQPCQVFRDHDPSSLVEQVLQPDHEAVGQIDHPAHG